jgi:hypothetical protein
MRKNLDCGEKLLRARHQRDHQVGEAPSSRDIETNEADPLLIVPEEGERQSILSRLSDHKDMLKEWIEKLCTFVPPREEITWNCVLHPGLVELLHCEESVIDFNDSNEWSIRLAFLAISSLDKAKHDKVLAGRIGFFITYLCKLEDIRPYNRLSSAFKFLAEVKESASGFIGVARDAFHPALFVQGDLLRIYEPVDNPADTTRQAIEAVWPSRSESSWIKSSYNKVTTSILAANEALEKAGSAINTAYNLFTSLLSIMGDVTDNSFEGRYISELILHMTSLDLKTQWSNVSTVWSTFMNNVGRRIPGMQLKVPGHDGFLGNYPIQTS